MTRRMLINAQQPEQLRVALATDRKLDHYLVDLAEQGLTRSNIYRGTVANIQPSLAAAFIDYGAARHGFLAIQDVVEQVYHRSPPEGRVRIEDVLERGRTLVVQVTKEPEGNKGAALTTNLSLAGRYLVFTPYDPTTGVSRKVEDEEERRELKAIASKLEVPAGAGVIVRTNAKGETKATLARDVASLMRLYKQLEADAKRGKGPKLLYSDQDLLLRALRDYLDASISEILVDDDTTFDKAEGLLKAFLPRGKVRLVRDAERTPLFARFGLDEQIESIAERRVELPSGGSIVIDHTEALTAIDVNSGRSTGAASHEEMALTTNLEAAEEVARQLALRDIGGLVVVDFIDMRSGRTERKVEKALRDAMKNDKARSAIGRISSNGLLEVNRQRISQALTMRTHRPCPACGGSGRIPSTDLVGLSLLRRLEARAASGTLKKARVTLHPEIAELVQNTRRKELARIESEYEVEIEIVASPKLERFEQQLDCFDRSPEEARERRPRAAAVSGRSTEIGRSGDDDVEPEEATEETTEDAAKRKRKRKRRSKKGKPTHSGEAAPRTEREAQPRAEAPAAAAAAAEESAPAGDEEAQRNRRKKRRRPRRKRRGAGAPATVPTL